MKSYHSKEILILNHIIELFLMMKFNFRYFALINLKKIENSFLKNNNLSRVINSPWIFVKIFTFLFVVHFQSKPVAFFYIERPKKLLFFILMLVLTTENIKPVIMKHSKTIFFSFWWIIFRLIYLSDIECH